MRSSYRGSSYGDSTVNIAQVSSSEFLDFNQKVKSLLAIFYERTLVLTRLKKSADSTDSDFQNCADHEIVEMIGAFELKSCHFSLLGYLPSKFENVVRFSKTRFKHS